MDASQVVDLVDVAVAFARRLRIIRRVVGAPHIDASGRAHTGAQFAADALLHTVLIAVEDVASVQTLRLGGLVISGGVPPAAVLTGGDPLEDLLERYGEAVKVTH